MHASDLLKTETVDGRDRTWTLRRATVKTERLFKARLERAALALAVANADLLGENGLAIGIQAVSRDVAARHYAWGRPGWIRCLEDDDNFAFVLWLMLTQEPTQRSLAFDEDDAKVDQLKMSDFFREKREALTLAWNALLSPAKAPEVASDRPLEPPAS